jgi:hypothetical protein
MKDTDILPSTNPPIKVKVKRAAPEILDKYTVPVFSTLVLGIFAVGLGLSLGIGLKSDDQSNTGSDATCDTVVNAASYSSACTVASCDPGYEPNGDGSSCTVCAVANGATYSA